MVTVSGPARGFWFDCSACGKCCDSAPLLSLPELFRHQEQFLGCLGIRRVRRFRTGETVGRGRAPRALLPDDVAALEAIARRCLLRTRSGPLSDDVLLALHGFDEPGLGRCPALGEDARCTLHGDRKPLECRAVPLDPLIPDRLQGLVLDARADEPVFSAAGCLPRAPKPGALRLVDDERSAVSDPDALRVLQTRREALAREKRFWGKSVFERLERDLFSHPSRFGQVPFRGFLVMSTPGVEVAGQSEPELTR
jgi:Fe-S-cluster containining protein